MKNSMDWDIYQHHSFAGFFSELYRQLKKADSKYSYPFLARKVGLRSASSLILIAQGKRLPSPKVVDSIADYFDLSAEQRDFLQGLVSRDRLRNDEKNAGLIQAWFKTRFQKLNKSIDTEKNPSLAKWYIFALCYVDRLKDFRPNIKWVADTLRGGFSTDQLKYDYEVLIDAGILVEANNTNDSESWPTASHENNSTSNEIPAKELRRCHKEFLQLAAESLENEPMDRRSISGVTLAIKDEDMDRAKQFIAEFQQKFCLEFEAKENADNIYHLENIFMPLTKTKRRYH